MREDVTEFQDMRLSYTREYIHPEKCKSIVSIYEEDLSVNIGQDWTALAVEVSEVHHHEESIDNESYEIVNVYMEVGLVWGCGSPVRKTSEN